MKKGDRIYTPRFCSVIIEDVLSREEAREQGYTEPTHYKDPEFDIYGKSTGRNTMIFAAVRKN